MDCNSGKIDLHIHSTASDGSFEPEAIIALAKQSGIQAMALTDHDSLEGVKRIQALMPQNDSIGFLTGVEISAEAPEYFNTSGGFHILGYGFDVDQPELNQALNRQQEARKNRNPEIIARLNALGFDITLDEVIAASEKKAQIGRPHIARLMVQKGFVHSVHEAFDRYLSKGQAAYLEKNRITTRRAIQLIDAAGGISVFAHPGLLNGTAPHEYNDLVASLIPMGLKGIEAYYPGHSAKETNFFIQLAKKFKLLITGGSDFHGAINPEIHIGTGAGNLAVPYHLYEALIAALHRKHNEPLQTATHESIII